MKIAIAKRVLLGCTAIALSVTSIGCPPEGGGQQTDVVLAETAVYDFYDFWPFDFGNYWLWNDAEYPLNWTSMEVVKFWDLADHDVWIAEFTHGNYGGEPFSWFQYWLVHPDGLYTTGDVDTILAWADDPDNLDLLNRWSQRDYEEGTHPYPSDYNPDREYTVDTLANLAPFERCEEDDPSTVVGEADDFIAPADTVCILVHSPKTCEDGSALRSNTHCFGLGIGPIIKNGVWNLEYALVDGVEYVLE